MTSPSSNGWPLARRAPTTPYKHDDASNPILRGFLLNAANFLIRTFALVRNILWTLNGFDKLRDIPGLSEYEACYDPCVVPPHPDNIDAKSVTELSIPAARKGTATYYTVGDYHRAYTAGKFTPSDVVEKLLPIMDRNHKPLSRQAVAFLEVRADIIRAAARASTERYKHGEPFSALDGVPIAVKDEIDLAHYSRSLGSRADFTNAQHETGWCVKKWEEAGAIIIGKTNMHEIGMDTNGNNPYKGTPLNPHNSNYYCGGSSSGSAMAVAAGICPIAHGADGGGSIRLPASFCGVYGLKPTHDRISGRPSTDVCSSVGVHGPMASDLDSLILAYQIMAQPDPEHRASRTFPSPLLTPDISKSPTPPTRKLIGIYRDWTNTSDPVVKSLFDDALSHYSSLGYETIDITLPHIAEQQLAHSLTITSEAISGLSPSQIRLLNPANQLVLSVVAGPQCHAQDFIFAQRLRSMIMEHLAWLWQENPGMLIVTPTTPCAGWKIGRPSDVEIGGSGVSDGDMTVKSMRFVFLANWCGCPALTRPMGFDQSEDAGIPVGIMAMAPWGSEDQLFDWARDGEGLLDEGSATIPKNQDGWLDVLGV